MLGTDERRGNIRFDPDKNALAIIHVDGDQDDSRVGLLRDESYRGCSAVFHREHFPYEEGATVDLKVEPDLPRPAEIVWTNQLDERLLRVGFHFVDDQ